MAIDHTMVNLMITNHSYEELNRGEVRLLLVAEFMRGGRPFETSPTSLFPHKTEGNEDVSC